MITKDIRSVELTAFCGSCKVSIVTDALTLSSAERVDSVTLSFHGTRHPGQNAPRLVCNIDTRHCFAYLQSVKNICNAP